MISGFRTVSRVGVVFLLLASLATGARAGTPLRVVASVMPVHSLVAGVMAGVGEPVLLLQGTVSPHEYGLKPTAARTLAQADVVVWVGEALETSLARTIAGLAQRARVVTLLEAPGVTPLPARAAGIHQDTHDHDHGSMDPHVWLDPMRARALVAAIVVALAETDPDHAGAYRANGESVTRRLERLDTALARQLEPIRDRPFVVFHDAYRYLEDRYGLHAAAAVAVSAGRAPGARRVAEIRDLIRGQGALCVFREPQFEPRLIATLTEDTKARVGILDPLGARLSPGPDAYDQLLEDLARSLTECLTPEGGPDNR